jgi:phage shock protein A
MLKRIWKTILRFLGLLNDGANLAMDNAVTTETKLKLKIKELKEKRDSILNNPKLAQAIGLPEELDNELTKENKLYANKNYEKLIKQLMENGKREQAKQILLEKKQHEDKITHIKEMLKTSTLTKEKVQKDLDTLNTNIQKATEELEAMKQRNRFAEQSNEIYGLMTEIEDISTGMDTEGLEDEIREKEQQAYGRRSEYERRTITQSATQSINDTQLNSELDSYLK